MTRNGVEALLRSGAAELASAGIDAPMKEARLLLAHTLGRSREAMMDADALVMMPEDEIRYRSFVQRRASHEPFAYITGQREFWSLPFRVTPDVLIPRPDSETLIEAAIDLFKDRPPADHILDLGTGSGCLIIALLLAWPQAQGTATDISDAALEVARTNADALGCAGRLTLVRGDWTEGIDGPFDLVVCNPPYIAQAEWAALDAEVRGFEPPLALTPGETGAESYARIIPRLRRLIAPNGLCVFEIGWQQAPSIAQLFRTNGFAAVTLKHDLGGRPRVLIARPEFVTNGPNQAQDFQGRGKKDLASHD